MQNASKGKGNTEFNKMYKRLKEMHEETVKEFEDLNLFG